MYSRNTAEAQQKLSRGTAEVQDEAGGAASAVGRGVTAP